MLLILETIASKQRFNLSRQLLI